MSKARLKEVARLGGLTVTENGTGHKWNQAEAAEAGKKTAPILLKRYGADYFKKLGARGGAASKLKKEKGDGSNS